MIVYWTRHDTHADRRIRYYWPMQQFLTGLTTSGAPKFGLGAPKNFQGLIKNVARMGKF